MASPSWITKHKHTKRMDERTAAQKKKDRADLKKRAAEAIARQRQKGSLSSKIKARNELTNSF